jgi:hypothetical protein
MSLIEIGPHLAKAIETVLVCAVVVCDMVEQ